MQKKIVTILPEDGGEVLEINSPLEEILKDLSVFDQLGWEKVGEAQVHTKGKT